MLSHGDELGRTQRGNNNAYCQDGDLTWLEWGETPERRELEDFVRRVLRVRREHPALGRHEWFRGAVVHDDGTKDVTWLHPEGREMTPADWADPEARVLGMWIAAGATPPEDEAGRPQRGRDLLLLLNGGARSRTFALPAKPERGSWSELLHTAREGLHAVRSDRVSLTGHALVLLRFDAEEASA
jgi:glycogen operon protein